MTKATDYRFRVASRLSVVAKQRFYDDTSAGRSCSSSTLP